MKVFWNKISKEEFEKFEDFETSQYDLFAIFEAVKWLGYVFLKAYVSIIFLKICLFNVYYEIWQ